MFLLLLLLVKQEDSLKWFECIEKFRIFHIRQPCIPKHPDNPSGVCFPIQRPARFSIHSERVFRYCSGFFLSAPSVWGIALNKSKKEKKKKHPVHQIRSSVFIYSDPNRRVSILMPPPPPPNSNVFKRIFTRNVVFAIMIIIPLF